MEVGELGTMCARGKYLLGVPCMSANIYCKSRNLPNTDTQNCSTDLRYFLGHPVIQKPWVAWYMNQIIIWDKILTNEPGKGRCNIYIDYFKANILKISFQTHRFHVHHFFAVYI